MFKCVSLLFVELKCVDTNYKNSLRTLRSLSKYDCAPLNDLAFLDLIFLNRLHRTTDFGQNFMDLKPSACENTMWRTRKEPRLDWFGYFTIRLVRVWYFVKGFILWWCVSRQVHSDVCHRTGGVCKKTILVSIVFPVAFGHGDVCPCTGDVCKKAILVSIVFSVYLGHGDVCLATGDVCKKTILVSIVSL